MIQEWKKSLAHEHRDRVSIISSHKVQEGRLRESLVVANAIFHELYEAVTRDASVTYT